MDQTEKSAGATAQKPAAAAAAEGASQKVAPKVESTAVFRALNPELFIKPVGGDCPYW